MAKKLFIGSLNWKATNQDLQQLFGQFGPIEEAVVVTDRFSGRSKGFGFVTFTNGEDADKAVNEINGTDFQGRNIVVNEALPPKPREDRGPRRPRDNY
jgi:RNA recognition motif-containing protein